MRITSFGLAILGVAISAYLTYEHFTNSASLACPDTGRVNCLKVTTSSYSQVLGVPVAVLGLAFFVVTAAAMSPWAWRDERLRVPRWVLVGSGLAFVLYLVWAELYRLDAICLWCTATHVVMFLLVVTVVMAEALRDPDAALSRPSPRSPAPR